MVLDVNDSVLKRSTVMDVIMSEDLKKARVIICSSAVEPEQLQKRLTGAKSYIKKCLSRRLYSKYVPELHLVAGREDITGGISPEIMKD
jgi:ribosome-binding factor A